MKKTIYLTAVMLAFCVAKAEASAVYIDTHLTNSSSDDVFLSTPNNVSTTWNFDITDQGYVPGTNIFSATVDLFLRDDKGPDDGREKFSFTLDGSSFLTNADANHSFNFSIGSVLLDLKADGMLTAVLTATSGDFYLDYAVLNATADDPPPVRAVSVPAAVWLFGSALLGLMGFTKRKPFMSSRTSASI